MFFLLSSLVRGGDERTSGMSLDDDESGEEFLCACKEVEGGARVMSRRLIVVVPWDVGVSR